MSEAPPQTRNIPDKVQLRWGKYFVVTVDHDIARKFAPSEYAAIRDAGAVMPIIYDVTIINAMMDAQQKRQNPRAYLAP